MIIGVRKESNGSIYIDKRIYSKTQRIKDKNGNIQIVPMFTDEQLSNPPYNYTKVIIGDIYSDCTSEDFNTDLTFSVDKYDLRKNNLKQIYVENTIVSKIRQKYNINQELAILRQRDAKPEEYQEYYNFVEQCKTEAKSEVLNDNNTIN